MGINVVVDAGASELRVGFAGETAPFRRAPSEDASLAELFVAAVGAARPPFAVLLEKTSRDARARKRLIECLFEQCDVPALYALRSATAALYALGRSSGEVFELSETAHEFATVSDGFVDQSAVLRGDQTPQSLSRATGVPPATLRRLLAASESPRLPDGAALDLGAFESDAARLIEAAARGAAFARPAVLVGRGYDCPALARPTLARMAAVGVAVENAPGTQRRELGFVGASIVASISEICDVGATRASYAENGEALLNKLFN